MNLFALSSLILGVTILPLGIFVYRKGQKSLVYRTLALFCIAGSVWGFGGLIIANIPQSEPDLAMLVWKITHIGIILMPVFLLHFIFTFLGLKRKKTIIFIYALGFFFLIANFFTDLFIVNMEWVFNSFYWDAPPGLLYYPFVLFFFSSIVYGHYELYKNLKKAKSNLKKVQIKYLFFAAFFGFSGGITAFLPCLNLDVYPILNFTTPLYPLLIAYAIIRHRLMDIKLVMRKSSVYAASFISIIILAAFTRFAFSGFALKGISWVEIFILILAIFIFPFLRSFYYRLANKYFFSSLYDGQEVIAKLSEKLGSTLNIDKIHNYIYESLNGAFHLKSFAVLKHNDLKNENEKIKGKNKNKEDKYIIQFNKDFILNGQKEFFGNQLLHKEFIAKGKPIVVEEIKSTLNNRKTKGIIRLFNQLGVEIVMPLNVGKKTIGLIALGSKESKDMYNDEDIQVLEIIGAQAAMAIQNALQYEATKDFNIRLQKEVAEATEDLRVANKELKKLDKAKTAFLSIASHQLRAPLTAIKGFASLLLDGSYGEVSSEKKEVLQKIFDSNERLSKLTENLLNISRIQSGRLTFTFEKNDAVELVQTVMDEMKLNAEKKGLYLNFEHEKIIEPFIFDKGKMHEVVINIVDNAIKYTKEGGIAISIKDGKSKLKILIKDTGIGIDPEDKEHIFKKFQRGQHASKVYTEGAGIGLFIVQEILKAHKGKLSVESPGLGKGSTFIIEMDKNFKPKSENGNSKEK